MAVRIDRIRKDVLLHALGGFAECQDWPFIHSYGWDAGANAALVAAHRQRVNCNGRLPPGALVEIAVKFRRPVKSLAQKIHELKRNGELPFARNGYGRRYDRREAQV